jgi:iron complex outermembrane receptor protein
MSACRAVPIAITVIILFYVNLTAAATELESVTVTATRFEQTDVPFPGSIQIIDAGEIRRSGVAGVADALRAAGGLQVSDLYGEGSRATVSMRGFGGNAQANTLILVDGRRLNNADLGAPDLNSVSLKDVDRIEILEGSAGALYGDQAVGGLINIITRQPTEFRLDAEAEAGSYNHRAARLSLEDRFATGISYRLSAEKRLSDNYRDNNGQDYRNLFGTLRCDYAGGRVYAEFQSVAEKLHTPGALFADQLAIDRRQAANPDDFIHTDTENLRLGLDQALLGHWRFKGEFSRRESHGHGVLSVGGMAGEVRTDRLDYQLTPRLVAAVETDGGRWLATVGADINRTDFFLGSVLGDIDNRQTRTSVYAQLLLPLNRHLTATLGARHASVTNVISGALLPPDTRISDDANAVTAGLSYLFENGLRLFTRFDSNYRFVLADEYTSASFGGEIPATQTGRSWELGLDWRGTRTAATAVVYQLDVDKEIDFDPLRFINTNIGGTRRRGVSLNASWNATDRLTLSTVINFVNAGIVSGPLAGLSIPFVAATTASVNAAYRFNDALQGSLSVHGISRRTANGDFFNRNTPLAGHAVGDFYLAWRRGPVTVGLKINNLLNKHYSDNAQIGFRAPFFTPETAYFPAPGRNFLLSLQYHHD